MTPRLTKLSLMVLELTYETYFMISHSFLCDSLSSLKEFADQLSSQPEIEQANIQLNGELGAGKSTFTRFLLQSMGVKGTIKSPTYAVMEEYATHTHNKDIQIWHFDFYRFNDPGEWEDAGFRDVFTMKGLKISEWPEKAKGYLPEPDLWIDFQFIDPTQGEDHHLIEDHRLIKIVAPTPLGQSLISGWMSPCP